MQVIVTAPFVGCGFNMPAPGSLLEVSEEVGRELLGAGCVARYETKVDPLPAHLKTEKKSIR